VFKLNIRAFAARLANPAFYCAMCETTFPKVHWSGVGW